MLRLDERSERLLFEECPELFGNKPPRRVKRRKKSQTGKVKSTPAVKLRGFGRQVILGGKDVQP